MKDMFEKWLHSFVKPLEKCSFSFLFFFLAKCWDVVCGLQLPWELRFRKSTVEYDSKVLFWCLNEPTTNNNNNLVMIL